MTQHLEECQRRVRYDLHQYNGQAQEHYGKLAKSIVKKQTNFRLGKKNHKGKYTKSYVQQMVEVMLHQKKLRGDPELAVRPSEYSRQKRKKRKTRATARAASNSNTVTKKAAWGEHHTPLSGIKNDNDKENKNNDT